MSKQTIAIKKISVDENLNQELQKEYKAIKSLEDLVVTRYVYGHHVQYVDDSQIYQKLVTTGLGTCIGVGVYNPLTHKTCLAHIDDVTTKSSVVKIISKMRTSVDEKLNVVMVGGSTKHGREAKEYLSSLANQLKKLPNIDVLHQDLFPPHKGAWEGQSLMIDTDGNFSTDLQTVFSQVPQHLPENEELRNIELAGMGNYEYPIVETFFCS